MTNQDITLNFYVWNDELFYITKAVDAFNALHEHTNINVVPLSNTNYEIMLKNALESPDEQVDLFNTKGMASIVQLAEENEIYNISEFVEAAIIDGSIDISSYGTMFNDITYNKQYYALPVRSTCWALYYNKAIFDQAGISYPSQLTWDEYAVLAKRLTNNDPEAKIWGGYFVNWIPNFLALQHGQYLTDDNQQYTRKSITYLNQLYNIDKSHVCLEDTLSSSDPSLDVYTRFENGEIAMVPQGEWMVNILLNNRTTVDWDIAPLPIDHGVDAGTSFGQYQFTSISANCKFPEQAFEFVTFLSGKSGAAIYAQNSIVPAYTDPEIIELYKTSTNKESTTYFFEAKKYNEQLSIAGYQETMSSFSSYVEQYFLQKITLDDAMKGFERERIMIFSK